MVVGCEFLITLGELIELECVGEGVKGDAAGVDYVAGHEGF